ncbi:MAG: hypothetical protein KAI43_03345 [Candidatus Aureabacteria bacterium]|nr:hypothetical protein [Candidatus Auribacterota bacterium]
MKILTIILLLVILPSTLFAVPADVMDISGGKYAPAVLEEINNAKENIFASLYFIGYYGKEGVIKDLMDALIKAKIRGVKVTIILDQASIGGTYTSYLKNERAFAYFLHHNIDIYYDDLKKVSHSKIIVIDSKTIILGSTNWSKASLTKNRESSVLIRSKKLAEEFLNNLKQIPKKRPVAITDGISIPKIFFENKIGGKLLSKKSHRGFDLYLLACKKYYKNKSTSITINKEDIMKYIMYSLPPKSQSRFMYKIKEVTLISLKKYGIISDFQMDYKKDIITLTIPSLNTTGASLGGSKGASTGVYLSNDYFDYSWHTKLSTRAKYAYLILLNETRNGALGRLVSFKSRDFLSKKYGMGLKSLTYAFMELQKYNLIERSVNYNVENPKTNDYKFNDFYDMQNFEVKLLKLASSTDDETFKLAYQTASKLNEPYDIKVIKSFVNAIKKYGTTHFKHAAKIILKKTNLSPYRKPTYLITILRKDMKN